MTDARASGPAPGFNRARFARNLRALGVHNPTLPARLRDCRPDDAATLALARTGAPTLSWQGRQLTSAYDPDRESAGVAAKATAAGAQVVAVFGFGLGEHVRRLLAAPHTTRVVAYEPDARTLVRALGAVDLTALFADERLSLALAATEIFFLAPLNAEFAPSFAEATLPGYKTAFAAEYELFTARIAALLRSSAIDLATTLRRDEIWAANLLENFPRYYDLPSVAPLKGRFRGTPAIIVAAGPSLDKNVALLPQAEGRALVIAVGAAAKSVRAANARPDLIVAVESNDITGQFAGVDDWGETRLCLNLLAFPALFALPFAGKFIFSGGLPGEEWMFRELGHPGAGLTVGGNVASVGYSLAVAMGCDPIVLIGQDLALGEDERVHAAGIADNWQDFLDRAAAEADDRGEAERPHRVRTPGYHGGEVVTLTNMLSYIQWYEHNIPRVQAMFGQRTINATEGGARLGGAEQMPLAEAIAKHLKRPREIGPRLAAGSSAPADRAALRASFARHRQTALALAEACAGGDPAAVAAALAPIGPLVEPLYRHEAWRAAAQWRDQEAERRAAIVQAQGRAAATVAAALERIVRFLSEPPPASA